jgi:protein transport protein SEC13
VWQLAWAHPKYGSILASCSYDGRIIVWRETGAQGQFQKLAEHSLHQASVNSVAWSPPEQGAMLLCASSDGNVSILEFREDGSWDTRTFTAHSVGCNSACWAPTSVPTSSFKAQAPDGAQDSVKRFASSGSDNLVKIWAFNPETASWELEETLQGHTDWVRDVAWASNVGLPKSYLASASQVGIP